MLYFLIIAALITGVVIYLTESGKIKDTDGDGIPDVIEDKIEDAKEVIEDVKEVIEDVKEVVEEVKKKPAPKKRAPRKPRGGSKQGNTSNDSKELRSNSNKAQK